MHSKVTSCYNHCSLQLLAIIPFVPHLCIYILNCVSEQLLITISFVLWVFFCITMHSKVRWCSIAYHHKLINSVIWTMLMDTICTHIHIHIKPLQDRYLALGVLVLVLVDVSILLVYTIVEGVQGNLAAMRVPNRENPMNVEGVGWYIRDLCQFYFCTLFSLFSLNLSYALHMSPLAAPISPPRNVKLSLSTSHTFVAPQPEIFSWASCMVTRGYCRSSLLFLPLQLARWRSRALMIPSILQQPPMWPALCSQPLSLQHTLWRILSIVILLSSALGFSLVLLSSWLLSLFPRWVLEVTVK